MGHGTIDVLHDFNMPAVDSGTTYTSASDQASTDVIDLGSASADIGTGSTVYVKAIATADTTIASSGTITISLQESSDNGDSDAFADIVSGDAFADPTEGTILLDVAVPKETERYLRAFATVATGNVTAGAFEVFLYTD